MHQIIQNQQTISLIDTNLWQLFVRRGIKLSTISILAVYLLSAANFVNAGPFIESGDLQLRSDLQLLNDNNVINIPMSTWPLAWDDVINALQSADEAKLTHQQTQQALQRIQSKLNNQYRYNHVQMTAGISGGNAIPVIRSFASTPREEKQIFASVSWMDENYAFKLKLTGVDEAQDNKDLRLDDSYASIKWGNWLLSAGAQDRWWGPGWQGSLIMSNNARPVPGITFQRVQSLAPETSWLKWLGPWSFMTYLGRLESERYIPDAKLWLARFTFKPFNSLEIGLSRAAQYGGEGRPEGLGTFLRMLFGQDNTGEGTVTAENQPGNQLAGYDVRWNLPLESFPSAFYFQWIGEDESGMRPTARMHLLGLEHWQRLNNNDYRLYVEFADTTTYRGLTHPGFNIAYNHGVYKSGYRYYGRSIGHSMDNDGRMLTLGGSLAQSPSITWLASISQAIFNRDGNGQNTVSPDIKTDYQDVHLGQNLQLKNHVINWGAGYQHTEQPQLAVTDDEYYIYMEWFIIF